ncbi:Uncharacterised protein [Mycobacteroides abscessus subsp. abscessus]|nr:Uncharacterised protein [Mycobacteroides abscessus subsp. abscessus]
MVVTFASGSASWAARYTARCASATRSRNPLNWSGLIAPVRTSIAPKASGSLMLTHSTPCPA